MELFLWVAGVVMVLGGLGNLVNKKNEKRLPVWGASLLLVAGVLSLSIVAVIPETQQPQGFAAVSAEDSRAISLVRATQVEPKAKNSRTVNLAGGVGVVCDGSAGYFVADGKVFAVNGVASNWSPGVEYRAGISFTDIETALAAKTP